MKRNERYQHVKRQFLRQTLIFFSFSGLGFLIFMRLFRYDIAESILWFIQTFFGATPEEALRLYWNFRYNETFLMLSVILLMCPFFIGFIYWIMKQTTAYFEEISTGLNGLISGDDQKITLSPELSDMEKQLNDLLERLQAREREAKEAEQRKNDLLMYLAHDLKTPLTSVIGYLSLLDEATDLPVALREKYVGITLDKANHLERLMTEFFEITRFNTSTLIIEKQHLHLTHLLWQLADEFYPQLAPLNKTIEIDAADDLYLWADGEKLARVLNNILRNAAIYSYEGTTIWIKAKKEGNQLFISLSNVGDSIPKEKLDNIFEKFFRLDTSRSTKTGGSGLGLAIAKEIVDAHGGTIVATSNRQQTEFKISLPTSEDVSQ